MMQIQYAKNLNPGRFVLSTTLSWPIWFIVNFPGKPGFKIDTFLTPMGDKHSTRFLLLCNCDLSKCGKGRSASMFHIN